MKNKFDILTSFEFAQNCFVLVEKKVKNKKTVFRASTDSSYAYGYGNTIEEAIDALITNMQSAAIKVRNAYTKLIEDPERKKVLQEIEAKINPPNKFARLLGECRS